MLLVGWYPFTLRKYKWKVVLLLIIILCRSFHLTISFYFHKMKYFILLCCVLASVAAKEKKINLEDIERDNIRSDKTVRTIPQSPKPQINSPSNYGFVPTRTAAEYARQQPKYAQYVPPQQFTPPPQHYQIPQQYYVQPQQQQPQQQQKVYQQQQQVYQPQQQKVYQQEQQLYQQQEQPNHYQQYASVPYISDNSISQQQYYTPQYVYLQQYTAPSTAIQTVVDPKGGIQYVMYIPSYVPKAEQSQTYENVVYTNDQQAYAVPETQYVTQEATPSIKYVPETPKTQEIAQPQPFTKHEPKSLLDSYVPSILQVQYYKQQQAQAQANAIQQSLKETTAQVTGKVSYVKLYKPQHKSAESITNYSYQLPKEQQYN